MGNRTKAMAILQEENELNEIVRLVGQDALSADDQLTLEVARMIREDFLQQNSFVTEDAYTSYDKQFRLLDMILEYDTLCRDALTKGASLNALALIPARADIGRAKTVDQSEYEAEYARICANMKTEIDAVVAGGEEE